VGLRGIITDLTKLKEAEGALRESEERFRLAFENANTGVSLVSTDGHFIKVNNRLSEIFGYSKEELEAMTVNDIAHPEDEELSPQFFRRSISGEIENTIYEKRYIHKQGHLVWGKVSSSIVRDSEGAPLYFISHVQDITQQKLAQQALEESQQKFSKLFQASPVFTCVTILEDGRFLEVNEAFMRITGYRREEVIGDTTAEVGLFTNPKERLKFVKLAREQGGFRDQEVNLLKKNGEPLTMLWSAEKIVIGDEDCLISAIADVTEIKKTQEALRESEGELKIKANKLEEINTALKVLLDKRDEDKVRLQEDILSNVKQLVEPYLENLKRSKLNSIQKSYLDILESNLKEIISPFIRALSSSYLNFTPTEIKIANLVRQGKSSKEIAELINSTKWTVDFHRNSIRKKLDIKHKKRNLRTQLLSISNQSPKYDQY
jgi:PAS domain S-box-containing protein